VAFAGLTAAGKTTHARLLAEQLGYGYVSATEVLLGILGIDAAADGVWFDRYDQIQSARAGDAADDELDRQLLALAAEREGIVFDTWALAWLSSSPMVRVWIESDQGSRTRKCLVSQPAVSRLSLADCLALVRAKDAEARAGFLRRHGFDLFTDRNRFDLVLSNSHLIPRADRSCADAGIETFAPVVLAAVTALLDGRPEPDLAALAASHPREILRIRRVPRYRRAPAARLP
jgi:cytidylate kinase